MSNQSLGELNLDPGPIIFHDEDFKTILEQNMEYLRNVTDSVAGARGTMQVPPGEAVACDGDFRKVCAYLNIPIYLWWLTMRINGLYSYDEYSKDMIDIVAVDIESVHRLSNNNAVIQKNI